MSHAYVCFHFWNDTALLYPNTHRLSPYIIKRNHLKRSLLAPMKLAKSWWHTVTYRFLNYWPVETVMKSLESVGNKGEKYWTVFLQLSGFELWNLYNRTDTLILLPNQKSNKRISLVSKLRKTPHGEISLEKVQISQHSVRSSFLLHFCPLRSKQHQYHPLHSFYPHFPVLILVSWSLSTDS